MRWSDKKAALAALGVLSALAGALLIAPSSASAEEAPGCTIWADPPQQIGNGLISAVGHRLGCIQNRREITVRIRHDVDNAADTTVAETTYENRVNGDFVVYWQCTRGDASLIYFAEILTNAGGSDQSPHIRVQCPRSWPLA